MSSSPPRSARAEGESSRLIDQLTLLYEMADHIQRARHVEHIYEAAVGGLERVLDVDACVVLVAEGDGEMRPKAGTGLSPAERDRLTGFSPWVDPDRPVAPVVVEDAAEVDGLTSAGEALGEHGFGAVAVIPLLHRGRLLGEILLARRSARAFQDGEVRLGEAIAGNVAFALWRSRTDASQAELLRRFEAERAVLESVVKQMPAGVILADVPSGRIVMTNATADALWGSPLRHASQVSDYQLWGGHDEAGRPLAAEDWALARAVLRGETVSGQEIRIEQPDGSHRVIRMSAAPVMDSQEQQLAAVATVYDVTAEQEHEERREFLQDATRALNGSLEVESTFQTLARLVLGRYADWCVLYRRTGNTTIERVASEHVDPAFADAVRHFASGRLAFTGDHPVARVIRENEPLLATEVTGRDIRVAAGDDEELIAVARTLAPTSAMILPLTSRGEAIGALSVVRSGGRYVASDIELMAELADRAALALDNALLFEKARSADAAKSNFLAVMSHEFRTPLSAILGYADILTAEIHGDLNDQQRTHLDRVKASVRHLSHLVDEILSFASMEAGRERVRKGRVDLTGLAADVVAIMEPIAEAAGLELRTQLPDEAIEVETDASKIRQILINLLSNALKYTVSGYVSLTVVIRDDRIVCGVRDTGPGIPEEHAERVFEPFWQVDRNDGRRISGTGLGLSVARRLARLLGGDLRLEPPTGEGSLFTLDLPMEAPDGVADGQTA